VIRDVLVLIPAGILLWVGAQVAVAAALTAADRGAPIRLTVPAVARLPREVVARVLFRVLGFVAFLSPPGQHRAPLGVEPRPRPPVMLVSGLTYNRASLWLLRTFLVQRGFAWVELFERQGRRTVAEDALALAAHVEALRAQTGAPRVDLVGFSSGGLVAARWVHDSGGQAVGRLVTVATAWRGTRSAVFRSGPAADELRFVDPAGDAPPSALDGLWPVPAEAICVVADEDPMIVPYTSALPAGARVVHLEDGGHFELLASARTFRAVLDALTPPVPG
jgi:pimeloyl-ACP methyl ester carboxylesterase